MTPGKLTEYFRWHGLRCFFEDLTAWRGLAPRLGLTSTLDQAAYDDLFKGTRADLVLPLWASCAKSGSLQLLDETTVAVQRAYKAAGYRASSMDGNPVDFIGQQFRFLEYLAVCGLKEDEEGWAAREAEAFLTSFTVDTVQALQKALLDVSDHPEIAFVCQLMTRAVKGEGEVRPLLGAEEAALLDSFAWERGEALPLEEEREVQIASFNDCGAKCLMRARVEEGCVLETLPDTTVLPFTGCARGQAYRQTFLTAHRLRYPMVRVGERGEGRFRRISWEEAAFRIAREIRQAEATWGPSSLFVTPASGVSALLRGDRFMKRLLGLAGGYLDYYNYYSAACANYVVPYVYGTLDCGHSQEDLLGAGLIVLWGHNPSANHFGPFFNGLLARAKEQGIPILVIDPRRTETALTYGTEWLPIRPSTDSALVDALCWRIWQQGLQDQAFMDTFCLGFDEDHMPPGLPPGLSYRSYLSGEADGVEKTPEWGEAVTGVKAEDICRLAHDMARAKPLCLLPGLGPQRTANGEQFYRSMATLACLTGSVGKAGGSSGGTPWIPGPPMPDFTAISNPYPGAIPSFLWTRALEEGPALEAGRDGLRGVERLDSGIKVIFNLANSLLLSQHSDVNRTASLLCDEDKASFIVVSDVFMTPAARYADLLLPAPSFFEVDNIVPPWVADAYLLYNHAVTEPLFECRFEYDWIRRVAELLDLGPAFDEGKESLAAWMEQLYEEAREKEPRYPDFHTFKEASIFAFPKEAPFIAFRDIVEGGGRFPTPSGKVEIFSKALYDLGQPETIPGLARYVPCKEGPQDALRERYPLQLVGYHTKRRCHSIHELNPLMEELEPPALWLHPADAGERQIADGDLVEAFNDRGMVRIPARVTDRIMAGVAALSEGGWHRPGPDGACLRGCINVLTHQEPTPLAKANPQHTNLVQVRRAGQGGPAREPGMK